MVPKEPPRRPQLGYVFVPPYRVQGLSVAGEESVVQVPELDIVFDIGLCPRPVLPSPYVALTHGHMDHAAGLSYYLSQRYFQGMGTGTIVCHPSLAPAIDNLMKAWVQIEAQKTPYDLKPLAHDEQFQIKPNTFLRAFETVHTVPSMGYCVVEMRSKLDPQYAGLTQEQLVELKQQGTRITELHEVPLVCYTGDTAWGPHFERDDVLGARILITECTFLEDEHRDKAPIGKHLHLDHIVELCEKSRAEAIVLTHLSRRTHMNQVRKMIHAKIPPEHRDRVLLLMDNRENRKRYEQQQAETEQTASSK